MPVLHAEVLARFGHALSDPTRTRLLLALREGPGYPSELADLLDVSRVTRGLVKLEHETLELGAVLHAALDQARPHIEAREHALHRLHEKLHHAETELRRFVLRELGPLTGRTVHEVELASNRARFHLGGADSEAYPFHKDEAISNAVDRVRLDKVLADAAREGGLEF